MKSNIQLQVNIHHLGEVEHEFYYIPFITKKKKILPVQYRVPYIFKNIIDSN